jgi:hypothetical protein
VIFIAITALSPLLFAATVALWVRSESRVDLFAWDRWPVRWNLDCLGGEVQLSRTVRGRVPSWRERDGFRHSSITLYGRPEMQKQEGTTRVVRRFGVDLPTSSMMPTDFPCWRPTRLPVGS